MEGILDGVRVLDLGRGIAGPMTGMLDTGNGILSANAVIQALIHRERTGEGQFVHTSILSTSPLFNSYTYARPDGSGPDRPQIDASQYGFSVVQRLYETAAGWICVFVRTQAEWAGLCATLGTEQLVADERYADATGHAANDGTLAGRALAPILATRTAEEWFGALNAAGVPCEIASSTLHT